MKSGEKVNIIDIREANDVASGKIWGAKHIPLGDMFSDIHSAHVECVAELVLEETEA
ncbi:rhodanese-like domain-containing protein [Ureibacillus chungkukjangi]|uniref:Rhodanese domain-containing protein n=1 Tax=Ureibacillus chungkukjangi TaxID=1202712 RepID=A0A318TN00_9BACL|nr:rhodanese-like domain-containing protein [Ureibacillus chungkukjangi]PYF05257.1 hypothetical protein BJ095_11875 [Ureibacillus chungkukjangi]